MESSKQWLLGAAVLSVLVIGCQTSRTNARGGGERVLAQQPVDPFPNPTLAPTDEAGLNTNGARFGCSRNGGTKLHRGTDLKADVGTSFRAIYSGIVQAGGVRKNVPNDSETDGVGNFVIVKSADLNISVKYCHLSQVSVSEGDSIAQGQILGKTGKSGNAFNVPFKHLHVEVSTDYFATANNYVDPEPYLKTKYGANPNPPTCE
jgi:murein DD-endopeptidase MepM/ murein hydrolase activator NlpD